MASPDSTPESSDRGPDRHSRSTIVLPSARKFAGHSVSLEQEVATVFLRNGWIDSSREVLHRWARSCLIALHRMAEPRGVFHSIDIQHRLEWNRRNRDRRDL